jgi:hypothetical protein
MDSRTADTAWYRTRSTIYWLDQYALNEQPGAFTRYDPDRIVEDVLSTGADIVAVYATNQFGIAYYPSRFLPLHPGLRGRDYVGELLDRFRAAGRRVVLYANWLDSKHPEWQFVPATGPAPVTDYPAATWASSRDPGGVARALTDGQWLLPCVFSPHRQLVLDVIDEFVVRYRPDGAHLDMVMFHDVCVCEYCRPDVERICGTAAIDSATLESYWAALVARQSDGIASLMADFAAICRRNGAISVPNSFAPPIEPAVRGNGRSWLASLDAVVSECFDAFLAPHTDLNTPSMLARWHEAVGKPSWILRTGHPMYYAHWPITRAQWEMAAAACIANNVHVFGPCGIGSRSDTTSAPSLLDHSRHGMAFFAADRDLAESSVSDARVAIGWSWATREAACAGDDSTRWVAELVGWGRLLIEEHIPFDLVIIDDATPDDLSRYGLVILPGLNPMGARACRTVTAYVERGGAILVDGPTSFDDPSPDSMRQGEFGLSRVLGIRQICDVHGPFAVDVDGDLAPMAGVFHQVETRDAAFVPRIEVDTGTTVNHEMDPSPSGASEWPACCTHRHGLGRSAYISFDAGAQFEQYDTWHLRRWLRARLDDVLPHQPVRVTAPRTVETTVRRDARRGRVVVHLANRTVAWSLPTHRRQPDEIVSVSGVRVEIDQPFSDPVVSVRRASADVVCDGTTVSVTIHRLDAYAAVVIDQQAR